MRTKIAARHIREALDAAQATGTRVEVWDSEVPNLHLVAGTSGSAVWYIRYRADGRKRRHRLGDARALTPAAAREAARAIVGRAAVGEDPAAEIRSRASVPTLGALLDWYIDTYVKTAGRLGSAKTPAGISGDRSRIDKHLRGKTLASRRVTDIRPAEIQALRGDMTDSAWRKVRSILGVCFAHAVELGHLEANPVARTKARADRKRERYLAPDERRRVDEAIARAAKIGPSTKDVERGGRGGLSPHLVRALRILLLTGARRGEVVALTWEMLDERRKCLRRVPGKTGERDIPLSPQALAYLKSERCGATGLVCTTGTGQPVHPANITRAWESIRAVAKLPGVRLHDVRHSWASDAISAGVPLYVVGAVLGHRQPTTTARYAHLHDKAIQEGVAKAGNAIAKASAKRRR